MKAKHAAVIRAGVLNGRNTATKEGCDVPKPEMDAFWKIQTYHRGWVHGFDRAVEQAAENRKRAAAEERGRTKW